jgi:agmatine deiminase
MMRSGISQASAISALLTLGLATISAAERRVPAEWEPQAATWLQWPGPEEDHLRPVFLAIVGVVSQYQPVRIIAGTAACAAASRERLDQESVNLTEVSWVLAPTDNSWLRDNGPVYVRSGASTLVTDWGFDAWGVNFGADIPSAADDAIPSIIAKVLDYPVESSDYILERGNLEVNGVRIATLN